MDGGQHLLGRPKEELDTPVLLLDLEIFEANLGRLAGFFRDHGTGWRPHSKAHKCPAIARMELAAGALGITCAKVSEAEMFCRAEIGPLLIANQIVTPTKLDRLAALQERTEVLSAVDNAAVLPQIAAAAARAGTRIPVVVEIDVGMHRVGVQPGEPALALAQQIERTPGLVFRGLMGYEGHVILVQPYEAKVEACHQALDLLLESAELIRRHGLEVPIVSAGGTGCYEITGAYPGITEVQAGGGIFMDGMYRDQCGVATLEYALTLLAAVTSRTEHHVVLDAGFKAMSAFHHPPRPLRRQDLKLRYLSAEHGVFELLDGHPGPAVGEQVELLVGYSDSTNYLHDRLLGLRQGRVERIFAIEGRGLLT